MEAEMDEERRAARDLVNSYDPEWDYSGLRDTKLIKNLTTNNTTSFRNMPAGDGTLQPREAVQIRTLGLARGHENVGKYHSTNTKNYATLTEPSLGNNPVVQQGPGRGQDEGKRTRPRPKQGEPGQQRKLTLIQKITQP